MPQQERVMGQEAGEFALISTGKIANPKVEEQENLISPAPAEALAVRIIDADESVDQDGIDTMIQAMLEEIAQIDPDLSKQYKNHLDGIGDKPKDDTAIPYKERRILSILTGGSLPQYLQLQDQEAKDRFACERWGIIPDGTEFSPEAKLRLADPVAQTIEYKRIKL